MVEQGGWSGAGSQDSVTVPSLSCHRGAWGQAAAPPWPSLVSLAVKCKDWATAVFFSKGTLRTAPVKVPRERAFWNTHS